MLLKSTGISREMETPMKPAESLTDRLAPLKSFIVEAETQNVERLSRGDVAMLNAMIEHAWPRRFSMGRVVQIGGWFLLGVLAVNYALSV